MLQLSIRIVCPHIFLPPRLQVLHSLLQSVFRLHCASSNAWDGGESCLVISVMITINRNQARVGPKEKNIDAEMQEALVITGWQDLAIITHY